MKIGVPLFLLRPESMAPLAQRAEELGFESVWLPEHLVFPSVIRSRYPYADVPPINPATPLLDPLVLLAQVAAVTKRIRLGTNIYVLPLRHPLTTARMGVTLDIVSQGRFEFGVGAGWLREEFEAVDIDFDSRGARLRECVRVLKSLWTEDEPKIAGKFYSFGPVKFEPKPIQKPHPPILFGGETAAALRRAAALGDGWYGVNHSHESAAQRVSELRKLLAEAGRGDARFEMTISCGYPNLTRDQVRAYEDGGIDRIVVLPWQRGREAEEKLAALARAVL